jgi:hypothetical protein
MLLTHYHHCASRADAAAPLLSLSLSLSRAGGPIFHLDLYALPPAVLLLVVIIVIVLRLLAVIEFCCCHCILLFMLRTSDIEL